MANPPNITQVDISQDISPDGVPLGSTAAPLPSTQTPPVTPPAPVVEPEVPAIEEGDEKTVDFSAFLDTKKGIPIEDKPLAEPAAEEAPSTEEVPTNEKPEEVTPVVPSRTPSHKRQVTPRDYSDIDEADKVLFRDMSNDAFNKLKPLYLENKKLKPELEAVKKLVAQQSNIPANVYEHPDGYILTPQYRKAASDVNDAQLIFNHWQSQLQAIEEGKGTYTTLTRDANNQLSYAQEVPVDSSSKTKLLTLMNGAQNQYIKYSAEAEALVKTHSQQYQQAQTFLKDHSQKSFAVFYSDEGKKVYGPQIDAIVESFPPAYRNNPLMSDYARALVMCNQLATIVQGLQSGKMPANGKPATSNGKAPAARAQQRRAGPTVRDTGAVESSANDEARDITFDAFQRVKQGL